MMISRFTIIVFSSFIFPFVYARLFHGSLGKGMLYPRDSETRQIKSLDGMWSFRADTSLHRSDGFELRWYDQALHQVYIDQFRENYFIFWNAKYCKHVQGPQ